MTKVRCGAAAMLSCLLATPLTHGEERVALVAGEGPSAPAPPAPEAPPTPDNQKQATEEEKRRISTLIAKEFRSGTETRDEANEGRVLADRLEEVLSDFVDIGGYVRAGYARSGVGGPMAPFQAPGAASKYRLGNEAENYAELILAKNFYLPGVFHLDEGLRADGSLEGPIARVQLRLSFFNPYAAFGSSEATSVGLPEAWASVGNVMPFAPSVKVWAGNRFYRRHDIHIIDFFLWNMSGGGGGIEDIPLGPAKLALAWLGWGSTSGLSYVPQPDPQNKAGFSKSSWDLRIYDLPIFFGHAELGLAYVHAISGEDQSGREGPESHGMSFSAVHTIPKFLSPDGVQKATFQYGTGPARTFTAGFETVTLPEGTFVVAENEGATRLRVTESFTANLGRHLSLGPVVIFQHTTGGIPDSDQTWVSAGVRPIIHFTKHVSVALDGGVDWVKDDAAASEGTLLKLTACPQVSIGDRWNSRPVVRAFVTGAFWTDSFVGQVGGADYAASRDGLNAGMQMEAWW